MHQLEISGVAKRYRGGVDALSDVDVVLRSGITGLLGPNVDWYCRRRWAPSYVSFDGIRFISAAVLTRMGWLAASVLSCALVGGLAFDVSAGAANSRRHVRFAGVAARFRLCEHRLCDRTRRNHSRSRRIRSPRADGMVCGSAQPRAVHRPASGGSRTARYHRHCHGRYDRRARCGRGAVRMAKVSYGKVKLTTVFSPRRFVQKRSPS